VVFKTKKNLIFGDFFSQKESNLRQNIVFPKDFLSQNGKFFPPKKKITGKHHLNMYISHYL
jgi:hypothetical protein